MVTFPDSTTKFERLSARLGNVPTSVMFELADAVRKLQQQGFKIIDLSLGQPDVPAPAHISKSMQQSLEKPITAYSSAAGSDELRSLIATKYSNESQVAIDSSNVIVTCGSKHALFVSLISLLDPNDEILVHEPYFPPYAEIAGLTGAKLKSVPVKTEGETFRLDIKELIASVSARTKVILINYPNNPAGWTLNDIQIRELVDFCTSNGVYLLSDEIYDRIVFDKRTHSHAWKYSDHSRYVIGLGSFSKTYSMVPYRLGFIIAERKVCSEFLKSQRATITMVSPFIQAAGVAALTGPQDFVFERSRTYEERRDRCLKLLKDQNVSVIKPEGAFYLFVKMPDEVDVRTFTLDFLEKDHVAILPGSIFGERWLNYVRMSFATPEEDLYPAVQKFGERFNSN